MKVSTTRLETFSDGVIAIALTIMVIALKLPDTVDGTILKNFSIQFYHLLPYFLSYVLSFLIIGIFWSNHHSMFHLLEKTDNHLIWMNFIFLFFLSLIPFATSILGANPYKSISAAIYGFVMFLTTTAFVAMRHYSIKKKLVHTDNNRYLAQKIFNVSIRARSKSIIGAFIYLCSVPLAFVHPYISFVLFIVPAIIFFIPEGIDNEKLAEKIAQKN
jgi:uncharacterized membrane protein